MIDHQTIEAMIPHKGGMCLWDEVIDWDTQRIRLRTASTRIGLSGAQRLLDQSVGGERRGAYDLFVDGAFHALEICAKGLVELVEVLLVLHQCRAGQVIEVVHAARIGVGRPHHVGLQGLQQRQEFLDRHRQLGIAQGVEERDQHGGGPFWLGEGVPGWIKLG